MGLMAGVYEGWNADDRNQDWEDLEGNRLGDGDRQRYKNPGDNQAPMKWFSGVSSALPGGK